MYRILSFLALLLFSNITNAQDNYHRDLLSTLADEYYLPSGNWLFYDNEADIISNATNYGITLTELDVTDQDYAKVLRFEVAEAGDNPWNAAWSIRNKIDIHQDDKILVVFRIRSINGQGKVNFFMENVMTYAKEAFYTLPVSEDWQTYYIPLASTDDYSPEQLNCGFHLANKAQTIELAGFTAINYNNTVTLTDLPNQVHNENYEGAASDAPWRTEAAQRIKNIRMSNLSFEVKDSMGNPVEGLAIHVAMQKHKFAFGTAVTANRFAGNNANDPIYAAKLLNLDGKNHGFNWVVYENDLKWPAWEDEWLVNKSELLAATQWLKDQGLNIRGHNLVWPGYDNLPTHIQNNINDTDYVLQQIDKHLEDILNYEGLSSNIEEWDVLNEIVYNRSLEQSFRERPDYTTGRELYTHIFNKAHTIDPRIGLWLNDFVTISSNTAPGNVTYDALKQYIQELIDADAPIEGIGFQGHIGAFPNGIPSVLATLDDFYNSFGLKAKITEFDMPDAVSEELGAKYLSDFLTAVFSHPSINGFLFWSFWDGATYMNPGTNLYRMDWSETPAHDAFVDLVFNQWWTDEILSTDATGKVSLAAFKGQYQISYECNGEKIQQDIELSEDNVINIVCNNSPNSVDNFENDNLIKIYPNPNAGLLTIEGLADKFEVLKIYSLSGKEVFSQKINGNKIQVQLPNSLHGINLLVKLFSKEGKAVYKQIISVK